MTKYSHKVIAVFLTFNFLTTIIPVNVMFSNNNGPVATDATSFEAIDSTDMVNLITGDMSYVIPLLNVPSPEGGYPLSLSYHAGIPMEQEASWVGLGWTLNPGAINRSVNGYPDDWKKTRINDFYYDAGGTTDYYSFSIGGTLPNGVTVGMSSYWGAYKAWGGVVGYGGQRISFNSEGEVSMGVSSGLTRSLGVGYNLSSHGRNSISFGYTPTGINPDTQKVINQNGFGANLSYGLNSGSVSANVASKRISTGISFDSSGFGFTLGGVSGSNYNSSISMYDYAINNKDRGFNIDVGFFWVSYRHRKVSYSLFKDDMSYISGIANTFDYQNSDDSPIDNTFRYNMDIKEFYADDDNYGDFIYSDFELGKVPTITLPNYDNYSVSAQGIGGYMSPRIFDEVKLVGRDYFNTQTASQSGLGNPTQTSVNYLPDSSSNQSSFKLGEKINFYFKNTNSSFLRISKNNFVGPGLLNDFSGPNSHTNNIKIYSSSDALLYDTSIDNTYSGNSTIDGYLKKNGNLKRDGNMIETFTVNDILSNKTNGWFIESKAKGFSRVNPLRNSHSYKDGIGAYRITTADGKIYHYSQPVYHYESVFKSFNQQDNENSKFFESKKIEPYATHWLLTAITGADYIDKNNNGKLDEGDLGYWVEFEYGKWSDGYGWRSPKEGFKVQDENNSYFFGVKEVYYLDQIKTRTHTALFIKSIRNDDKSHPIQIYNQRWSGNNSNLIFANSYSKYFVNQQSKEYTLNGNYYKYSPNLSGASSLQNYNNFYLQYGYKFTKIYMDIPENRSLKLDKILVLKNEDANYNKTTSGALIDHRKVGHTYHNAGISQGVYIYAYNPIDIDNYLPNYHNINSDNNILDNYDILGLQLESKAIKQIVFDHDYSLSSDLPNSTSGHLALKKLHTIGKNNTELMPPYVFDYLKPNKPYNTGNQDVWGYVKNDPDAWSLNKITTPLGGKLEIEYESDSFYTEAAYNTGGTGKSFLYSSYDNQSVQDDVNVLGIDKGDNYLDIYFDPNDVNNLAQLVTIGQNIRINISVRVVPYNFVGRMRFEKGYGNNYTIQNLNLTNSSIRIMTNELTDLDKHKELTEVECPLNNYDYTPQSENEHCIQSISFSLDSGYFTYSNPNGKTGGGLRVKSVSITDGVDAYKTSFNYRNPINDVISGITSYEPFDDPNKIVPYIEEIPSPNVMYSHVCVSSLVNNIPQNFVRYHFKTLEPYSLIDNEDVLYSLGHEFQVVKSQHAGGFNNNFVSYSPAQPYQEQIYKHTIHNNLSAVGKLLSIKSFNLQNQLLESSLNQYSNIDLHSENHSYGISQESFKTYKLFEYKTTSGNIYGKKGANIGSSSLINYPSVLESTTTTHGGFTSTTTFDRYDFLTGQVLEATTRDSKGVEFKTETVPAYTIPVYNPSGGFGMGSKVDNPTNKNMLTQETMTKTYLKVGNDWKETGVGIATWNNHWSYTDASGATVPETLAGRKIWRKHKNFVWDGALGSDGTYSGFVGDNDSFNWAVQTGSTETAQPNPKWKNVSTTTQYDHYSMPLEARDINGNYASTKMGDGDSKVLAVGNAKYTEMFYSGAEYLSSNTAYFDGHIKSYGRNTVNAHTGKHSISVAAGGKGFEVNMLAGQHRAGKYKVSVWVLKTNHSSARINIKGTLKIFNGEEVFAGNWVLKTHYEDLSSGAETIFVTSSGSPVYFDDFRLRPVSSSMASYVYNEWDELWYVIGNNDLSSKFEYDNGGRLVRTYSEVEDYNGSGTGGFKKIGETGYAYKGTTEGGFIGPPPTEEVYISSGSFVSNNFSNPTQVLNTSICNTGTILTKAVGLNTSVPKVGTQIMINGVNATQSMVSSAWGVNYSGGIRWVRFYSGNVAIVWDVNPITGIVTAMSSVYSCN